MTAITKEEARWEKTSRAIWRVSHSSILCSFRMRNCVSIITDSYHFIYMHTYTWYLLRNMRAPFGDRRRIRRPTTPFLGNEKNVSRNCYSSPCYPPAPTRKRSKEWCYGISAANELGFNLVSRKIFACFCFA